MQKCNCSRMCLVDGFLGGGNPYVLVYTSTFEQDLDKQFCGLEGGYLGQNPGWLIEFACMLFLRWLLLLISFQRKRRTK